MQRRVLVANLAGIVFMLASLHAVAQPRVWNFAVFLNDAPIGHHRFTLRGEGAEREMKIEARFHVKVLFVNAYRYAHDAIERWRGACLESLTASTDDDGEKLTVDALRDGDRLTVTTARGRTTLSGCAMSFAYWNPEILRQSSLLNAQTGEYDAVAVIALGDETITVRGSSVAARHFRIIGPRNPIDLWYSAGNEWLALESTLAGGRRLRYRLN